MGLVYMPLAKFGSLVLIKAEMDAHGNVRVLERVRETQVGRRVITGVPAHDEQHVHLAGAHVGDEIFDRLGLIDRIGIDGIGVENRSPDVAESLIDRMSETMHDRRLMCTGNNNARAAMRL